MTIPGGTERIGWPVPYNGIKLEQRFKPFILPLPLRFKANPYIKEIQPIGFRRTENSYVLLTKADGKARQLDFGDLACFDVAMDKVIAEGDKELPVVCFDYLRSNDHTKNKDVWTSRRIIITDIGVGIYDTHRPLGDVKNDLWIEGYDPKDKNRVIKRFPFFRIKSHVGDKEKLGTGVPAYEGNFEENMRKFRNVE